MANIPPPAATFDSANRDRAPIAYDVMRHGPGNVWEDRGNRGVVPAFFVTCLSTLFHPVRVCDQIRRPETTGDATAFTIGCGIFWGLGWVINGALYYYRITHNPAINSDPNLQLYIIERALQFILAVAMVFFFVSLGSNIFYKLVAGEMQHKFNRTLAYNVMGYCMGPAILAVVPLIGIPLALLWSLIDTIIVARTRLYLRAKTAIICTLMIYLTAIVLIVVGYFAIGWIWQHVAGDSFNIIPPPPKVIPRE